MKKSLVLAMAMAMGVTASAFAANPFTDVPAGHWAYDAVAGLQAAGVVEGYGDTFNGNNTMTRYEMAQIVAKAMAKGANCDKLAAEFHDELDALGVKVAKLEKKFDNVKITGNIRYSYSDNVDRDGQKKNGAGTYNRFRTRLFVSGQINNNWKYTGMLENDRMLGTKDKLNTTTGEREIQRDQDDINLKRAFLNGRIGGVKVEAGRCYFVQGDMIDERGDGVKVAYSFGKVNLEGWALKNFAGKMTARTTEDEDRMYMAKASTKFGKLGAFVQYWDADTSTNPGKIYEVGVTYPVAKGLMANAQYYRGDADISNYKGDDNGWEIGLKYMGAKAAKPGTWGVWATYSDRPADTYILPSCLNTYGSNDSFENHDGFKGFEVGANYTFAKNIVGEVRYFNYEGREKSNDCDTLWAHVVFTF